MHVTTHLCEDCLAEPAVYQLGKGPQRPRWCNGCKAPHGDNVVLSGKGATGTSKAKKTDAVVETAGGLIAAGDLGTPQPSSHFHGSLHISLYT